MQPRHKGRPKNAPLVPQSTVAAACLGDQSAVSILYEALTPALTQFFANRLRNQGSAEDAEDLVADTWTKALASLPSRDGETLLIDSWLFTIAGTVLIDWVQSPAHRLEVSLDALADQINDGEDNLAAILDGGRPVTAARPTEPADPRRAQLQRVTRGVVRRLSDKHQRVIGWLEAGETFYQIGLRLDYPDATARDRGKAAVGRAMKAARSAAEKRVK